MVEQVGLIWNPLVLEIQMFARLAPRKAERFQTGPTLRSAIRISELGTPPWKAGLARESFER